MCLTEPWSTLTAEHPTRPHLLRQTGGATDDEDDPAPWWPFAPNGVTIAAAARRFLAEKDLALATRRVCGLNLDALAHDLGPRRLARRVTPEKPGHLLPGWRRNSKVPLE